jgi:hypothetical protein
MRVLALVLLLAVICTAKFGQR